MIIFFKPVDLWVIRVSDINSLSKISIPDTKSPLVIPVAQKTESPDIISFNSYFLFKSLIPMGIKDLNKKYELNEIISGDSVFCATGITNGDLVSGIEILDNEFISETLITHKSTGLKKIIKKKQNI